MAKKQFIRSFVILLIVITSTLSLAAKEIPSTPNKLVNDYAKLLNDGEVARLERKLVDFDNNTSNQIAVVIIESLEGDDEFEYAQKLATEWGIGSKQDNGVLLLISKNDRKIRIQTGYGAEGVLPDITSKQIIENEIKPYFKQGQFFQGIDAGTNAMMAALKGEYNTKRNTGKQGSKGFFILPFLIFLIIIWRFRSRRTYTYSRDKRYVSGPDPFLTGMFLGELFRDRDNHGGGGGFGGGSFGGGGSGFGGFGGGSFGGGGASGSW